MGLHVFLPSALILKKLEKTLPALTKWAHGLQDNGMVIFEATLRCDRALTECLESMGSLMRASIHCGLVSLREQPVCWLRRTSLTLVFCAPGEKHYTSNQLRQPSNIASDFKTFKLEGTTLSQ